MISLVSREMTIANTTAVESGSTVPANGMLNAIAVSGCESCFIQHSMADTMVSVVMIVLVLVSA